MKRLAAIDIGTNSILLTIAERQPDGSAQPLYEEAHITRIGQGVAENRRFLPEAMQRTAAQLEKYVTRCREASVAQILAVGTAAFRIADNREAFVTDMERRLGVDIEVISPQREAELSYQAAAHDFGREILVVDIGGGSTEFIWEEKVLRCLSLPLGSVTFHERYVHSDPISDADQETLRMVIQSELLTAHGSRWGGGAAGLLQGELPPRLVALAGTATTLAAMYRKLATYSHADVHSMELSRADIEDMVERLRRANIAERKKIPGIEAARADVILVGAEILAEIVHLFEYERVTVSDRGVRWGLIYEAFNC